MNSSTNLISIVTPTFNSAKNIEKNINSILNQTYKDFEQIVIDNESKDATLQKIKRLYFQASSEDRLTIICEKDKGIGDAFNKGIKFAKGNIITILNSDDYYIDNNLFGEVVKSFEGHNNCLFVHGDIFEFDPVYGSIVRFPKGSSMRKGMIYNHPTMFFRKEVYEKYGGFNLTYKYAMDFEFLARLERLIPQFHTRGIYLQGKPKVFMSYGGNSWSNMLAGKKDEVRALKENSLWNFSAKINNIKNVLKIRLKQLLVYFGFSKIVQRFRQLKWKLTHPFQIDY